MYTKYRLKNSSKSVGSLNRRKDSRRSYVLAKCHCITVFDYMMRVRRGKGNTEFRNKQMKYIH